MKRKILCALLSLTLCMSVFIVPVSADDTVLEAAGSATVGVTASLDTAVFNVTVPTSLSMHVAYDGTCTFAEDISVTNNSNVDVYLTKVHFKGTTECRKAGGIPTSGYAIASQVTQDSNTISSCYVFTPSIWGAEPEFEPANATDGYYTHGFMKSPALKTLHAEGTADLILAPNESLSLPVTCTTEPYQYATTEGETIAPFTLTLTFAQYTGQWD